MNQVGRRSCPLLHPITTALLLSVSCLGCKAETRDRSARQQRARVSPAPPGAITSTSADRVRLGMTAEQAIAPYGSRARRATVSREGTTEPVIQVSDSSAQPLLIADLVDGRVTRIHVRGQQLTTIHGARVGTRFRTLEQLYGRGQVLVGEGNLCAVFPHAAPGLSFCLGNAYQLVTGSRPPAWSQLRRANPPIEAILVVGTGVREGSASSE